MEYSAGNIQIRPNYLQKKGDVVDGHAHNFDHVTVVFEGSIHVRATLPSGDIIERNFVKGSEFLVKAEVEHEITALEDNTLFKCYYAHRTPQGDIVQEYNGWTDAYDHKKHV